MRKSPYRHKVRTYHRRSGTTVHQYERGKGKKPFEHHRMADPNLPHRETDGVRTRYDVHITYVGHPAEIFSVVSSSYPETIESALSKRNHITVPWHIRVVRA
jgi:hypothetical protein